MQELSRPAIPAIQVRTLGPVTLLREALERKGVTVSVSQTGVLTVQGDTDEDVKAIWRTAAEHDIVIRSLMPARNSMETIFLEAVQAVP
jgi:ABC-2 type transport system ATP-binding protein